MLSERQCPGLVEDDRRHPSRFLEATSIANEQAIAGTERRGDGEYERHRQPERVRTGNHQHGDESFDCLSDGRATEQPCNEGEHAGAESHPRQPECRAICKRLRTRARALRVRDQSHDPGQRRPLTRTRDLDPERTGAVDRARDHRGTDGLRHRRRLSGKQRLIDIAATIAYHAVGRHSRSWPDQHDITDGQITHRHIFEPFAAIRGMCHTCRHVGQQFRELTQRTLCLRDRPHLEPVAEQHDGDERREFFPERHARKTKRHEHTEHESDSDCERD